MPHDLTAPLLWRQPRLMAIGPGHAVEGLRALLRSTRSARAFLVGSPSTREPLGRLRTVLEDHGVAVAVSTPVPPEPTTADCERRRAEAAAFRPDLVVAVGGGSVLDVAKLVAALHDRSEPVTAFYGIGVLAGRRTTLVCVPTTAGTGSEVSPNALLLDDASCTKKAVISPDLVPDAALVDPTLMLSLPPALTATTGIDALCHCLEAYANLAAHPFTDVWALRGVELIGAWLPAAVHDSSHLAARTAVATGSLLGGLCLGPVNTAAVHALAYPLGGRFHLAHGLSIALLLPAVVAFNVPAMPARYATLARALGAAGGRDDTTMAAELPGRLTALIRACGVPLGLATHGLSRPDFPALVESALTVTRLLKNNPRPVTPADALAIYEAAFATPSA